MNFNNSIEISHISTPFSIINVGGREKESVL
jgi:hypothetical protein